MTNSWQNLSISSKCQVENKRTSRAIFRLMKKGRMPERKKEKERKTSTEDETSPARLLYNTAICMEYYRDLCMCVYVCMRMYVLRELAKYAPTRACTTVADIIRRWGKYIKRARQTKIIRTIFPMSSSHHFSPSNSTLSRENAKEEGKTKEYSRTFSISHCSVQ